MESSPSSGDLTYQTSSPPSSFFPSHSFLWSKCALTTFCRRQIEALKAESRMKLSAPAPRRKAGVGLLLGKFDVSIEHAARNQNSRRCRMTITRMPTRFTSYRYLLLHISLLPFPSSISSSSSSHYPYSLLSFLLPCADDWEGGAWRSSLRKRLDPGGRHPRLRRCQACRGENANCVVDEQLN